MAKSKKGATKPILPEGVDNPTNDLSGVKQRPASTEETGPPIDNNVCIPKPPGIGNWHCNAVNGVIQNPANPWLQD